MKPLTILDCAPSTHSMFEVVYAEPGRRVPIPPEHRALSHGAMATPEALENRALGYVLMNGKRVLKLTPKHVQAGSARLCLPVTEYGACTVGVEIIEPTCAKVVVTLIPTLGPFLGEPTGLIADLS